MEATPAAAPPMAVSAATPVAMDFTVFTGPPSIHMDRGGISRMRRARSHVFMVEDGVSVPCDTGICVSGWSRYDDATAATRENTLNDLCRK
jgi:hypothetical protein